MSDRVAAEVLRTFGLDSGYTFAPMGNGLIHTTSVVSHNGVPSYVLQRLNTTVFPDPQLIAENISVVTGRIGEAVRRRGGDPSREVVRYLQARDGRYFTRATDGSHWRICHYVRDSFTIDIAEDAAEAASCAAAFASFLDDLWDVDPTRIRDAIPGFHDTPRRFRRFTDVVALASDAAPERLLRSRELIRDLTERAATLGTIETERQDGALSTHVCHFDTKVNNVLLDRETRKPLCVIDMDTLARGSPLMDLGDLLRTAAATESEEEQDASLVEVDPELAKAIVDAFTEVLGDKLNQRELSLTYLSGWIITMEQCIRYLTDYLEGDIYYSVDHESHNFQRACNQLALARSMEEQLLEKDPRGQ